MILPPIRIQRGIKVRPWGPPWGRFYRSSPLAGLWRCLETPGGDPRGSLRAACYRGIYGCLPLIAPKIYLCRPECSGRTFTTPCVRGTGPGLPPGGSLKGRRGLFCARPGDPRAYTAREALAHKALTLSQTLNDAREVRREGYPRGLDGGGEEIATDTDTRGLALPFVPRGALREPGGMRP